MSQSRLNSLALRSTEKETLNSIDFTSIIDEFASVMKARRVHLYSVICDFCECVYTKRNTEYSQLVCLALMLFVFPRLCIDVVQFRGKFAVSLSRKS